jgi:hypothetical protein
MPGVAFTSEAYDEYNDLLQKALSIISKLSFPFFHLFPDQISVWGPSP